MICEKYTNPQKNTLAVEGGITWPDCCILCGCDGHKLSNIRYLKASPVAGYIQESSMAIPLCDKCSSSYYRKMKKINLIMIISFVTGMCLFIAMFPAGLETRGYDDPLIATMGAISAALIVAAFLAIKAKAWLSPLKWYMKPISFASEKYVILIKCGDEKVFGRLHNAQQVASRDAATRRP